MKKIKKQIVLITTLIIISHGFSFGQGIRYTGSYTPSGAIVLNGASNQVISGLSFTGLMTTAIQLWECSNITVKNCKFSKSTFHAITAENAKNLTITDCVFDSVGNGVVLSSNAANPFNNGTSSEVKIIHNYFKNIIGGWPGSHAVFLGCANGGGIKVNYNSFENIHLQSHVDDIISSYASNGSVNDSIQIIGNWIRGGDHNIENHTGSGITFGDGGGSYIHVKNNILVNVVSGGIGNAGASNCIVENNTMYQSQALANPLNQTDGYIMNPPSNSDSLNFHDNTWKNNRGYSLDSNGADHTFIRLSYIGNYSTKAIGLSTNIVDRTLNASILPDNIAKAQADTIATPPSTFTTFKLNPNPQYNISIAVTAPIPNNGKIIIYNTRGKMMIQQSINNNETLIDTSKMPSGVYVVKLYNNGLAIDVRKITIAKT